MSNPQCSYEKTVKKAKRVELGIVYTPLNIVSFINEKALSLWKHDRPPKFIDPCCGTGAFLEDMANKVAERYDLSVEDVYRDYAYGIDLDEDAIMHAKTKLPLVNLETGDSLGADFSSFDIIVTNPPYVRIQNLDEETRHKLKTEYSFCSGDTDIYMAFLEKILKSGKINGLIIPNSWLKNANAKEARKFVAEEKKLHTLVDFGSKKVFDNADTYTSILVSCDNMTDSLLVGSDVDKLSQVSGKDVFLDNAVIVTSLTDAKYVKEVHNREDAFLDVFDIKVGLATLADDVFCLELVSSGEKYSLVKKRKKPAKGKEEIIYELESSCLVECIRAGDIDKNKDKKYVMIYPYDEDFKALKEEVIKDKYPKVYDYLALNKERLAKRDKGKNRDYEWTSFGRTQALTLLDKEKIVFSTMINNKMSLKDCPSGTTFVSGYCFIPKHDDIDFENAKSILLSPDLLRWAKIFGKDFGKDWTGISKETFKNYKIDLKSLKNNNNNIDNNQQDVLE